MNFQSEAKEDNVSVHTNDIHQAIARTGSALYDLLEQALMTAEEEDESEFLQFARETLNVLAIHAEQLSDDAQCGETESEQNPFYPEPTE